MKQIWESNEPYQVPFDLKRTLGTKLEIAAGNDQQDSGELLLLLLDLIHEDLNRIVAKTYTEMSEDENRPDEVIAEEYWNNHKARDDSIVTDLMFG